MAKLIFLLRRKSGTTREQCLSYWAGGAHTALVEKLPGLQKWVQNAVTGGPGSADCDGIGDGTCIGTDDGTCAADCRSLNECGNGVTNAGEECDDGNNTDGDGCDTNCTVTACGNGVRTGVEVCDDGGQCSDGTTNCESDLDC